MCSALVDASLQSATHRRAKKMAEREQEEIRPSRNPFPRSFLRAYLSARLKHSGKVKYEVSWDYFLAAVYTQTPSSFLRRGKRRKKVASSKRQGLPSLVPFYRLPPPPLHPRFSPLPTALVEADGASRSGEEITRFQISCYSIY